MPLDVQDSGSLVPLGAACGTRPDHDFDVTAAPYVFPSDRAAFQRMVDICCRDLSHRVFRDDLVKTFTMYAQAKFLLHRRVFRAELARTF